MGKRSRFFLSACLILVISAALLVWMTIHAPSHDFQNIQTPFFDGKNVLFIVPHQDDDLNLAGGVIEQYTQGNNQVRVVFCTNGDYAGLQETRIAEAMAVMDQAGVPEENVHFLGFGDLWEPMEQDGMEIEHIYNCPDGDLIWQSAHGAGHTYGTRVKACYLDAPYTRNAYRDAFVQLLQDFHPDVVYVNDYDNHVDHRAISLLFEEAMGIVLKEDGTYHPTVFKGFCYTTAWEGLSDFKGHINILSSKQVEPSLSWEVRPYYSWDKRVRVPVAMDGLSKYISQTASYHSLSLYESQDAIQYVSRVTNSDKVYWQRRTDSLLYDAAITVGGLPAAELNDFKLLDSSNICQELSDLGVVYAAQDVTVSLPRPKTISRIGLYDDPDAQNNILSGLITFDNGISIPFDTLDPNGCLTYIDVPETDARSFTISVTGSEGYPGLMEVEAYHESALEDGCMMLVDADDNFVYDHILPPGTTTAAFSLYSYPLDIPMEEVSVSLTGDAACSYEVKAGNLLITFPSQSASCTVKIAYEDQWTTARLTKPSSLQYRWMNLCQTIDYRFNVNLRVLLDSIFSK